MHIVPGLHLIEDMIKAKTMWTLSGHQLTFTSRVRNLLEAWGTVFTWNRLELAHGFLMGFPHQKPFPVTKTRSFFVQSKARWFKTRHPKQPLLSHRQPRITHVNGLAMLSICTVFWRRDFSPTPPAAANIHVADMGEATKISLHTEYSLQFVCLDTATCWIFPLLVSPFPSFYFIFLSPPSKEVFIVVFWYGRLFFLFQLTHTFRYPLLSLSILHLSCMHAHRWPRRTALCFLPEDPALALSFRS